MKNKYKLNLNDSDGLDNVLPDEMEFGIGTLSQYIGEYLDMHSLYFNEISRDLPSNVNINHLHESTIRKDLKQKFVDACHYREKALVGSYEEKLRNRLEMKRSISEFFEMLFTGKEAKRISLEDRIPDRAREVLEKFFIDEAGKILYILGKEGGADALIKAARSLYDGCYQNITAVINAAVCQFQIKEDAPKKELLSVISKVYSKYRLFTLTKLTHQGRGDVLNSDFLFVENESTKERFDGVNVNPVVLIRVIKESIREQGNASHLANIYMPTNELGRLFDDPEVFKGNHYYNDKLCRGETEEYLEIMALGVLKQTTSLKLFQDALFYHFNAQNRAIIAKVNKDSNIAEYEAESSRIDQKIAVYEEVFGKYFMLKVRTVKETYLDVQNEIKAEQIQKSETARQRELEIQRQREAQRQREEAERQRGQHQPRIGFVQRYMNNRNSANSPKG